MGASKDFWDEVGAKTNTNRPSGLLKYFALLVLSGIFLFFCKNINTKKSLTFEDKLISTLYCTFDYSKTGKLSEFCSAYEGHIDSITHLFKLVISKGSINGKILYAKNFNYAGTEQNIESMQIEKRNGGQYLVYWGYVGKAELTRIVSMKKGEIQEIAQFWGLPEFADIDSNGIDEIIVSHGLFWIPDKDSQEKTIYPDSASIYSWRNEDLVLVRKVSWGKRFYNYK